MTKEIKLSQLVNDVLVFCRIKSNLSDNNLITIFIETVDVVIDVLEEENSRFNPIILAKDSIEFYFNDQEFIIRSCARGFFNVVIQPILIFEKFKYAKIRRMRWLKEYLSSIEDTRNTYSTNTARLFFRGWI